MQIIRDDFKKNGTLHHAYLLVGLRSEVLSALYKTLESDINFPIEGNPDLWQQSYNSFGIDESRALKEVQMRKPVVHDKHIFIVQADSFTLPAQNALLKALEEPAPCVHFFFITPHVDTLIPTLLSRLSVVYISSENISKEMQKLASEFVLSTPAKRIEICEGLYNRDTKDKQKTQLLFSALENIFYKKNKITSSSSPYTKALQEIMFAKEYVSESSSSIKMAIEHLSLVLPICAEQKQKA